MAEKKISSEKLKEKKTQLIIKAKEIKITINKKLKVAKKKIPHMKTPKFKKSKGVEKILSKFSKIYGRISNGGARVIFFHDKVQAIACRKLFIMKYYFIKTLHESRELFLIRKKYYISHFLGVLLIAIAVVTLFDYATAYEYSYNGRVLGYVRNQEDVTKILDLVSKELSEEYKSNIEIQKDSNITFRNVVAIDKDIDDIDTVLKRLTYMSDMKAQAVAIFADGKIKVIVENRDVAREVLTNIQEKYLTKSSRTTYEEVGFVEKISLKTVNTKLAYISSEKAATRKILTGGEGEIVYKVKSGDTISGICSKFDISQKELKKLNSDLNVNMIHIGQKVIVSKAVPSLNVQTVEISTYPEVIEYKTKYKKTKNLYKGETSVSRQGSNGKQVIKARIIRTNGNEVEKEVLEKEVIKKPVSKLVLKGTNPLPPTTGSGNFIMPVSGYSLSSVFGYRWGRLHEGIDLACSTGTTIRASDGGTVVFSGWYYGYGYMVEIDHGNGLTTRYGHCNTLNVSSGEKVYRGQKIAEVGNTGNSYGSHCHFEIRESGTAVDPFKYL